MRRSILAGNFYPDTRVASLVTTNIRYFGIRKLAPSASKFSARTPSCWFDSNKILQPSLRRFAALRSTLRSAPAPDHLLERLAADGQVLTAAPMRDAWQQGAVRH